MSSGPFVILGGGPCGLSAAWRLAQAGKKPVVIEREPLVGGLCATHERDGFRFDLGGHRFVSSDAALSRDLEALLSDDLLTQERRSVVLHDGRAFRYPLEATDLLRNLGPRANARALLGYARARLEPRRDRSFEDWVISRFGRPLYDTFFGPYTEKLWGIHPSRISSDWAAERISLLNLSDVALRLVHLRQAPVRTYARRYRYPRWGMGQLYEVIAREVRAYGGEVKTGTALRSLETRNGRVIAVHVDTPEGRARLPVGELLSTIPLPELARALDPCAPEAIEAASRALKFRSIVFLNVMLARRDFSENTWMYVADGGLSMSRIQEPKRRSESMAPTGRTSIMLEVPCDEGDGTWASTTSDLHARMTRELASLNRPIDDALGSFSVKVAHGYPIYHLDYDKDRRLLLEYLTRWSNVRTAGRQGLFRYVFMDAAMQMGVVAAEQMMMGARDASRLDAIGRARHVVETRAVTA